ncbi:helix-turn-helix transcriptional regulator [Streptomyces heilongjiangensis]|uniref:AAA family ATPase n=1 Tax=Streptomyces heilongjiangensis TaxID=945052 RepID=A0ABW1BJ86_9ACTN|nr:LuxR family transcriptional regulator [Streptomyces heilongjiangensis]MDC2951809.1 AAA family ATPase [Streptomyces heilongjiangensis]
MLLERQNELRVAVEALRLTARGSGSLVVIAGPPGIGRSALLAEIGELAARSAGGPAGAPRPLVMRAYAAPAERDLPLGVARQLLEPVVSSGAFVTRWGSGPARPALAFLQGHPESPRQHSATTPQALLSLVEHISQDRMAVLLVDDLHWADEATLDWLDHLARQVAHRRILVVATVCEGEHPAGPPGDRVLGAVEHTLRPAPLGASSVEALVLERLGATPDPEFAAACLSASRGNPLHLVSLLQECRARGVAPVAADAERAAALVPPVLRRRLLLCLRGQPLSVLAVARALLVLGDDADPAAVGELAGLDPVERDDSLWRLRRLNLITREDRPRLAHRVVHEVVEEATAPGERDRLHQRAAALLRYRGGTPEQVAAHLLATTAHLDKDAVAALREAAGAAVRRGDPETAARYLRAALRDALPHTEERAGLLVELAAVERSFAPSVAIRHVAQAFPLLPGPVARAQALTTLTPVVPGVTLLSLDDLLRRTARELGGPGAPARDAGDVHGAWGGEAAGTAEDVGGPGGHGVSGGVGVQEGVRYAEVSAGPGADGVTGPDDRESLVLRLEARLRHLGENDPAVLASAGERLAGLGEPPALDCGGRRELLVSLLHATTVSGTRTAATVAALARRVLDHEPARAAHVHTVLPLMVPVLVTADSLDGVSPWLDTALADAERRGGRLEESVIRSEQALVLLARGRWAAARERAVQACSLVGPKDLSTLSALATVMVALRTRAPELADALPERLRGVHENGELTGLLMLVRGAAAEQRGEPHRAVEHFLDARYALERAGWRNPAVAPSAYWLARALHRTGATERAEQMSGQHLELARAWGAPAGLGRALALHATVTGRGTAPRLLREAAGVLEDSADLHTRATVLLRLAEAVGARQAAEAEDALRRSYALAVECGATAVAVRAQELLGATAVRAAGRSTQLTPAERMVARMAVQGLTNQAIADALGVSRRAVEKHLTSCYRKTSASGRAGLATVLGASDGPGPQEPPLTSGGAVQPQGAA